MTDLEALESALADYGSQLRMATELSEGRIHEGRNRPASEREMRHWQKADVSRQAIRDLFKQQQGIPLAGVREMLRDAASQGYEAHPGTKADGRIANAILKEHGYE